MKKKVLMLSLAGILCCFGQAWAAPFPDKTNEPVQDADGFLNKQDCDRFAEMIKQYPDAYKVVVVENTQPEAQSPDEYARKLYDNYNLSDNTLMIVLDEESQELGVYAGPALAAKGATAEMLHEKIAAYYDPYRTQKEYMKGIQLFVSELNAELNRLAARGQAKGPVASAGGLPLAVAAEETEPSSGWSLPWWLYLVGVLLVGATVAGGVLFARRREVYGLIDELEDAKDGLAEKVQLLEVDKPLRRATGATEERFAELANRKENLLRIRIPDVEMIILEAEEACDRFRFAMARGLIAEGWDLLAEIEQELNLMKEDAMKVVQTKKENRAALPEIGKTAESLERKLTNLRLEYGLPFHQLKVLLDEVEQMRSRIKTALADGDDVKAHELNAAAQDKLAQAGAALEKLPGLVKAVTKELPQELKQLEDDIAEALGDGYDLNQNYLDASLLQVKQLLIAATTALEEGDVELVETHRKAFAVKLDAVYQAIEESVLSQREAAIAEAAAETPLRDDMKDVPTAPESAPLAEKKDAEPQPTLLQTEEEMQATVLQPEDEVPAADQDALFEGEIAAEPDGMSELEPVTADERQWLLKKASGTVEAAAVDSEPETFVEEPAEADTVEPPEDGDRMAEHGGDAEDEYELEIPKHPALAEEPESLPDDRPWELIIETEEDALDELERISNSLLRIRQKIKRSYLPGVPDEVRLYFDQVVQALAQTKHAMQRYGYELEEVAQLLKDAHALLAETERVTERTIAACQRAEGAIQYTNRYRRLNRKINERLNQAEQAFRQLRFEEALQIAEEARLMVEGEPKDKPTENRWLLRRKQKGADR